jgi:hypothetical protein
MWRRLGILSVLLLCLSGFIPTVWACASMEQHADCCPPGHPPCDTDKSPLSAGFTAAACCVAQPAPTQVTASISIQKDHALNDGPELSDPIGIIESRLRADRTQRIRAPIYLYPFMGSDQQQLYLQTARLRL